MSNYSRREFLGKIGSGMLVSAGGLAVVSELDLLGLVHAGETDRLELPLDVGLSRVQRRILDALPPRSEGTPGGVF